MCFLGTCVFSERVSTCTHVDKSVGFKQHSVCAVWFWTARAGAAGLPDGVLAFSGRD